MRALTDHPRTHTRTHAPERLHDSCAAGVIRGLTLNGVYSRRSDDAAAADAAPTRKIFLVVRRRKIRSKFLLDIIVILYVVYVLVR